MLPLGAVSYTHLDVYKRQAFWKRANQATVTWASANTSGNRYDGTFTTQTSFLTNKLTFSAADSKGNSTSATKLDNVKSINFHLPHADQILFNGVQYNGDDDIPIPVGMFGAETLSFTYYQSDYVLSLIHISLESTGG